MLFCLLIRLRYPKGNLTEETAEQQQLIRRKIYISSLYLILFLPRRKEERLAREEEKGRGVRHSSLTLHFVSGRAFFFCYQRMIAVRREEVPEGGKGGKGGKR